MLSVDDKENKHPLKERPVLTDPSDVFGDDKVTITDEVDGFIDANIDIPEINNEVSLTIFTIHPHKVVF